MKRYQAVTEKKISEEDKQVGMKSFPNEAISTPKEKKKKHQMMEVQSQYDFGLSEVFFRREGRNKLGHEIV